MSRLIARRDTILWNLMIVLGIFVFCWIIFLGLLLFMWMIVKVIFTILLGL